MRLLRLLLPALLLPTLAAGEAWPADWRGVEVIWGHREQVEVKDAQGEILRESFVWPRGNARFTATKGMRLDDGHFALDEADVKAWIGAAKTSGACSVELAFRPWQAPAADQEGVIFASRGSAGQAQLVVAQAGDRLLLRLGGTGQGQELALGPIGTGWRHLVVSSGPGRLAAWLDGQAVALPKAVPAQPGSWSAGELTFGADAGGRANWSGEIEGVLLRSIAVEEAEARLAFQGLAPRFARPAPARTVLQGKLVKTSPHASAMHGLTEVYARINVVYRYQVEQVLSGAYPHPFVHVAHWAVLERRELPSVTQRRLGASYRLELEEAEAHPWLGSETTVDRIEEDFDLPLMLDVGSLGSSATAAPAR